MLRSLCLRASVALSFAPAALAQTAISGTLYDGAGGPLQSGVVYHVVGAIVVPAGTTLTAGASAILKSDGQAIYVRGALLAQGTAAQPVIFSSIHDDAAGGDTNDRLGFPRFLEGDLDGLQRIDRGAHEHDNVLAAIFGDARPGGTLTLATFSLPPIHTVFLAIGAGPALELPLAPYGAFFPNLFGAYVLVPWATAGSVSFTIPLEIFTPVDLVVQEVGFAGAFERGNTSNPSFLTIR
ncbi:MAG: hypothetical protein IPN34_26140 [Planctomycetes bacterium]|nr:hypothetical protein [Planctomycetota bacterium]